MSKLTLTFDNGPTPGITDRVLSVLHEFNVRATFFLVGSQLQQAGARALAMRAQQEGHWIGNHTLTHGVPLGLQQAPGAARREIGEMEALLFDLCHPDRFFRPNGRGKLGPHLLSPEAIDVIKERQNTLVLWSSVPLDRKVDVPTPDGWLEQAKRDVLSREWTVMVLHDRPSGHEPEGPMNHLGEFLSWAQEHSVELVQEFPGYCTPILRGRTVLPLEGLVSPPAA